MMQDNIIAGIMEAKKESYKRNIEANAVLINDRLLYSKLQFAQPPRYGGLVFEIPMVCGLRAYYTNELPDKVLFAVCHGINWQSFLLFLVLVLIYG